MEVSDEGAVVEAVEAVEAVVAALARTRRRIGTLLTLVFSYF